MYEITIKQMVLKKVPGGKNWKIIDERPYTKKEAENMNAISMEDLKKFPLKKVYGHTPEIIIEELVEVEILKQTVNDLNITAVIKAINGIK